MPHDHADSTKRILTLGAVLGLSAAPTACFDAEPLPGDTEGGGTTGATGGTAGSTTTASSTSSGTATGTGTGTSTSSGPGGDMGPGCMPGLTVCDGQCVDTNIDPMHCGDCGTACMPGDVCLSGSCEPDGVAAIEAGEAHTCALAKSGRVRCWGKNSAGQLGTGTGNNIGDDEKVADGTDVDLQGEKVVQLALGKSHTCALFDSGDVACWGANTSKQLGFAGNGLTQPDFGKPVQNVSGATAIFSGPGANHTCAVVPDGVKCWGANDAAQLGQMSTAPDGLAPVMPLNLGGLEIWKVALGLRHTCALLEGGEVICWGTNDVGQLGSGDNPDPPDPPTVIGDNEFPQPAVPPGPFDMISAKAVDLCAGEVYNCAVLQDGNGDPTRVACWGRNTGGKLGYGPGVTFDDNLGDFEPASDGPVDPGVALASSENIVDLACGSQHTCVVFEDGAMQCWGVNGEGQLGYGIGNENIGDNELANDKGPLEAPPALRSVGGYHRCMLTQWGGVRCWGKNNRGQLGLGSTKDYGVAPGEVPNALDDLVIFPPP